jgi:CBS domain-containing protein
MRLGDIMSKPLLTVEAGSSVRDASELMRLKGVHHLAVTGVDGRVFAIVSHHDLAGAPVVQRVGDTTTGPVVTATRKTTVREAANLLRGRAVGCLIIREGKRNVGIVTVSDLLELLGRGAERPVERAKRWTLRHRGPRGKAGTADA